MTTAADAQQAGVQATARWIAAVRAVERERPDPLVDDPWAAALAGDAGMAWVHAVTAASPGAVLPIIVRARFFDDWLREAEREADGAPLQVVVLGAGLDTRAWRLPWPAGTSLYELDRDHVLAEKTRVLAAAGAEPACRRVAVPVDLLGEWSGALCDAGFDPARRSVVLAEGILFYLPDDGLRRVLRVVTALAAPGSRLGFDLPNRHVLTSPYTKAWVDMQAAAGAPWLGTMDDPAAELTALGWEAAVTQPGEGESGHGRWTLPVVPAGATELPHSWYVTARRTG